MNVRVSKLAARHLLDIHAFIARDQPGAADKVLARVRQAIDLLGEHPWIGRPAEASNRREWIVPRLPYIVSYRINERTREVTVLTVHHGARSNRGS